MDILTEKPLALIGAGFLFFLMVLGAKQGLPYLHVWDEPMTASNAIRMAQKSDSLTGGFLHPPLARFYLAFVDIIHYHLAQNFADPPLLNKNDVRTFHDEPYYWTISHPSFYFWNRIAMAFFGVGTFLLLFGIGRLIGASPLGAALAAAVPFTGNLFLSRASMAYPDIMLYFWLTAVSYCTVRFGVAKQYERRWLYCACFLSGLAATTKYNGASAALMPFLAFFLRAQDRPQRAWLLPVISGLCFFLALFIGMPQLVFHYADVRGGFEAIFREYLVTGSAGSVETPGLTALRNRFSDFSFDLGTLPVVLGIIGLTWSSTRRSLTPLFVFVVFSALSLSRSKNAYIQNWLVLYPFLGIGIGFVLARLNAQRVPRWVTLLGQGAFATVIAIGLFSATQNALQALRPDSRTAVIPQLNALAEQKGIPEILVGKRLRFHLADLSRLQVPFVVVEEEELLKRKNPAWILVASEYAARTPDEEEPVSRFNKAFTATPAFEWGADRTYYKGIVVNPKMKLLSPSRNK